MKTLLALLVLCLTGTGCYAQDVITLTSNSKIKAKVISLDSATLTYLNNSSDVIHNIPINTVMAIRYGNGTQKVISVPGMADRVTADSILHMNVYTDYMTLARKRTRAGIVLSAIGAPLILGGTAVIIIGAHRENQSRTLPDSLKSRHGSLYIYAMGSLLVGGGVGMGLTGMGMFLTARKYRRKANEIKATLSFYPSTQPGTALYGPQTGLSMRLTF